MLDFERNLLKAQVQVLALKATYVSPQFTVLSRSGHGVTLASIGGMIAAQKLLAKGSVTWPDMDLNCVIFAAGPLIQFLLPLVLRLGFPTRLDSDPVVL